MDNTNDTNPAEKPWRPKRRGLLPAVFITAGGVLLARQLGAPIPGWVFSWQMLLIAVGIFSGIVERFRGAAWLIMILVGGFFLVDDLLPNASFHDYLWPIGLIGLGIILFIRPKKAFCGGDDRNWQRFHERKWRRFERMVNARGSAGFRHFGPDAPNPDQPSGQPGNSAGPAPADPAADSALGAAGPREGFTRPDSGFTGGGFGYRQNSGGHASSEDYIDATVVLGAVQKNIVSKNFRGGDLTVFMGGTEINLTQADIQGTARMDITQIMGGTKLIVPPHWEVQTRITSVFGNVEDKRVPGNINKDKILILDGTSVFGGIEIRSY